MDERRKSEQLLQLLEERRRRDEHPFNNFQPYNTSQEHFFKAKAYLRLLFGGNRSGKSHCAAYDAVNHLCGNHPHRPNYKNPRIWCLSSEYRTLSEGLWHHLRNFIPNWWVERRSANIPGWDIPHYIRLKPEYGGGQIDFISAQGGEEARRKLQAAQVDGVYIDEEIDGIMFHEIEMRLLDSGGFIVISATLVRSEDWILDLEREADEGNPEIQVFRLRTDENPYLSEIAVQRIMGKLSSEETEVRILGLSRKTSGLIYKEDWKKEFVIEPRELPPGHRILVLDPGFRIFAGLWLLATPEYTYIYKEMYLQEATLSMVMKIVMAEAPAEQILIDPAAFRHREDGGPGIGIVVTRDYGIPLSPAQNDVDAGIRTVQNLLHQGKFLVFNTCVNFLRERARYRLKPPSLSRDKDEGVARPIKREDHLMDCWRYASMYLAQWSPRNYAQEKEDWQDIGIKYGLSLHERLLRDQKRLDRIARTRSTAREYAGYI